MLFGITGRARNGKTTVAEAIAFRADKAAMIPVTYDIGAMVLEYCKEQGLIPSSLTREELSKTQLGTLVSVGKQKREENPRFWIGRIEDDYSRLRRIEKETGAQFVALIPNVRYRNEFELVRALGGRIIKMTALNDDGSPFISTDRDPNHPSETELLGLDADYYLTAKTGQSDLVEAFAGVVFYRERKAA